jgi:hypothetical protein
MKKILSILLVLSFSLTAKSQWLTDETYGRSSKGVAVSRVILFPTGCGTPANLSAADAVKKMAALFADTCNNRFYFWNSKTSIWDTVHIGVATGGISSTDNTNAGTFYRLLKPSTQSIKTIENGYGFLIDSFTNHLTFYVDSATLFTKTRGYIRDSLNANKLYIRYGFNLGDSISYFKNDSTLIFKDFVLGYGISPHSITDTTTGLKVDTSFISTIARAEKIVDDSSAVLRALIGSGGSGAAQSPWTQHIDGNNFTLKNVSGLQVKKTIGSGTTTQNELLYSEELNNGAGWASSGVTVTANQANDVLGNPTLEKLNITSGGANVHRSIALTVTPSTTYQFSFDVARGTATDLYYSVYDVTNGADIFSPTNYYSSTSASASRFTTPSFTTASNCTSIFVYPVRDNVSTGTVFVGRAQLAYPGNAYIATSGSTSGPSGGGTTTVNVLKTDSSGRVHVGDSAYSGKFNVNGVSYFSDSVVIQNNEKIIFGSDGDYIGYDSPTQTLNVGSINDTKVRVKGFSGTFIEVGDSEIMLSGSPTITGKALFQDSVIFNKSHKLKFKNTFASSSSADSVLVINSNGELKTRAQRDISGGGLTPASFVYNEEFTGSTSSTYTLANTPVIQKLEVFKNGVKLPNSEFSLSGATVTLTSSRLSTDILSNNYIK